MTAATIEPTGQGCPPDSQEQAVCEKLASLRQLGSFVQVDAEMPLEELRKQFEAQKELPGVLVVHEGELAGAISRDALARTLSRPFALELHRHRSVGQLLEHQKTPVCVLPESMGIADAVAACLARAPQHRYAPVVVQGTEGSWYLLDVYALLEAQCQILTRTLEALQEQRRATLAAQREREEMQQRLMEASREAGRAEVATGVLHNVGNVLNSVNTSVARVHRTLQQSKLQQLGRAVAMFAEHGRDLEQFLSADERGKTLPGYLGKLAGVLAEEQRCMAEEVAALNQNLEHIKQVVQMQQSYARRGTVLETAEPATIVEDALRVNMVSFDRHQVSIVRNYEPTGSVPMDRHKVLQVLINLISNAKNATKQKPPGQRQIMVRVDKCRGQEGEQIQFVVADNGMGIAAENLTRIFAHGFTTRREGHGFGLHSAANAAKEMGGTLVAASEGIGQGATFTLTIPLGGAQGGSKDGGELCRTRDDAS